MGIFKAWVDSNYTYIHSIGRAAFMFHYAVSRDSKAERDWKWRQQKCVTSRENRQQFSVSKEWTKHYWTAKQKEQLCRDLRMTIGSQIGPSGCLVLSMPEMKNSKSCKKFNIWKGEALILDLTATKISNRVSANISGAGLSAKCNTISDNANDIFRCVFNTDRPTPKLFI